MAFVDVSLRIALAATFLFAAGSKIYQGRNWQDFVSTVRSIDLVPVRAGATVAATVVAAEFVTALSLLIPYRGRYGPAAGVVLLTAFSAVIARSIWRKDGVSCSCFGRSSGQMQAAHLYRTSILLAMALFALILASSSRHAVDAGAILLGIPVGIFWAFFLAFFTEFFSLLQPGPITRSDRS